MNIAVSSNLLAAVEDLSVAESNFFNPKMINNATTIPNKSIKDLLDGRSFFMVLFNFTIDVPVVKTLKNGDASTAGVRN